MAKNLRVRPGEQHPETQDLAYHLDGKNERGQEYRSRLSVSRKVYDANFDRIFRKKGCVK